MFWNQHTKKIIAIMVALVTLMLVFSAGFFVGSSTMGFSANRIFSRSENELNELFDPYVQAWEIVHDQYLNQPVDDTGLMRGSIRGMMNSLEDPYSAYMDPQEYEILNTPLQGEYTGIGAWVDTSGDYLIIISPMPDSPAEEAGLQPEDKVVGIDGEDVTGLNPELVLDKIIGPAGTIVHLTIERETEEELLNFEIERAVIPIPSVESELLENGIGYIRLYTFGANSGEEVKNALSSMNSEGITGLILDLRNNTGGFVDSAVDIVSLFVPEGTVLIEEWPDGTTKEYKVNGNALDTELPIVLLVNNGSASASEITAGALQDHDRASLVGTQTFGKGLIQNWIPLINNNGAIRITIARWLTPEGRQIQEDGLEPDFVVELSEQDLENGIDTQLEKAKEILSGKTD